MVSGTVSTLPQHPHHLGRNEAGSEGGLGGPKETAGKGTLSDHSRTGERKSWLINFFFKTTKNKETNLSKPPGRAIEKRDQGLFLRRMQRAHAEGSQGSF